MEAEISLDHKTRVVDSLAEDELLHGVEDNTNVASVSGTGDVREDVLLHTGQGIGDVTEFALQEFGGILVSVGSLVIGESNLADKDSLQERQRDEEGRER